MIRSEIKQVNAGMQSMHVQLGMALIDEAISSGHDRRLLRWRVSAEQGRAMFLCSFMMSVNPSPITVAFESGSFYELGNFCGIPYAVDRNMPANAAMLEILTPEPICEISNLQTEAALQR